MKTYWELFVAVRDSAVRRSAGDLQGMLALDGAAVKVALDALRGAKLVRASDMDGALSYAAAEGIADDAAARKLAVDAGVDLEKTIAPYGGAKF